MHCEIKPVNGVEELDNYIMDNNNKLVLYFGASWCDPCAKLKKNILESNFKNLNIAYIDVDDSLNEHLIEIYDVKALPTTIFIDLDEEYNIKILSRIEGNDISKFRYIYNSY